MAVEELKQVWNSIDAVAIAVATAAIAILEHWQKRFRVRYLADCDMKFPNLEDARPRLPFTLIFNYQRNKQAKEKRGSSNKTKNRKKNKGKTEFKSKN